jgi:transposase-like protein
MNTYKRHRFPPDIISYAVWLYCRFNLIHRDIEDLLAEHGTTNNRFTKTPPALRRPSKIQDNKPQRGSRVGYPLNQIYTRRT